MKVFKSIGTAAVLALGVAGLSTGTAVAQEGATPAKAKTADKSGSRRVCRNIVESGTRLSSRVCRTQADWDKAMLDSQNAAFDQQNGPGFRSGPEESPTSAPR